MKYLLLPFKGTHWWEITEDCWNAFKTGDFSSNLWDRDMGWLLLVQRIEIIEIQYDSRWVMVNIFQCREWASGSHVHVNKEQRANFDASGVFLRVDPVFLVFNIFNGCGKLMTAAWGHLAYLSCLVRIDRRKGCPCILQVSVLSWVWGCTAMWWQ